MERPGRYLSSATSQKSPAKLKRDGRGQSSVRLENTNGKSSNSGAALCEHLMRRVSIRERRIRHSLAGRSAANA